MRPLSSFVQLLCFSDWLQVVPDEMADKLFEACGTDSFDKLDSTVKVRLVRHICVNVVIISILLNKLKQFFAYCGNLLRKL